MTWTVRSVLAFGFVVFAATLGAEGLYHLIGAPICESTPGTPVRCSEESGWWVLVLGLAGAGALAGLRSVRGGSLRRVAFGLVLLAFGLAPLWAAVDDRTDSGTWIAMGSVTGIVGVALLAGVAATALRAVRQPDAFARLAEPAAAPQAAERPVSMADPSPSPAVPAQPTPPAPAADG
ncbi:MAG TPA: hypothetical protein VNB64_07360, partial [Solirubrobacteraceae bacterium]|nr:hypothetical protein [Solirubrobacteraceae bacterium]